MCGGNAPGGGFTCGFTSSGASADSCGGFGLASGGGPFPCEDARGQSCAFIARPSCGGTRGGGSFPGGQCMYVDTPFGRRGKSRARGAGDAMGSSDSCGGFGLARATNGCGLSPCEAMGTSDSCGGFGFALARATNGGGLVPCEGARGGLFAAISLGHCFSAIASEVGGAAVMPLSECA